jgi:transposase
LPEHLVRLNKAGSKKMEEITTLCAGIDTGKDKLDIAAHGSQWRLQVDNSGAGFKRLVRALRDAGVTRVGIEASGGYERGVTRHLRAQGIMVLVLQPAQVKAFARLHLRRAKNDAIDAGLIAACTAALDPAGCDVDSRLEPLADQLTFVEQLEEDIARFKTRLEHITDPRLRSVVTRDITRLKARRTNELIKIVQQIRRHADLATRLDLVQSVPGIGERTALAILLRLPELGRVTREQAAALAGLAPFDQDSGRHHGQRHIAAGRARLRRSLYAAALPAVFQWNPALKAFYGRLIARGKAHKAALVACARKLLVYANTVVTRGQPWRIDPVTS